MFAVYQLDLTCYFVYKTKHCIARWLPLYDKKKPAAKEQKRHANASYTSKRKEKKKADKTHGRIRAWPNISRCQYIGRVIWKSPDLPLYSNTRSHAYVNEKRHGSNFVALSRRSTVTRENR